MHYVTLKLSLLEVYIKLKEVGSLNAFIDYGELQEMMEKIQTKSNTGPTSPSPIDGILKILQ